MSICSWDNAVCCSSNWTWWIEEWRRRVWLRCRPQSARRARLGRCCSTEHRTDRRWRPAKIPFSFVPNLWLFLTKNFMVECLSRFWSMPKDSFNYDGSHILYNGETFWTKWDTFRGLQLGLAISVCLRSASLSMATDTMEPSNLGKRCRDSGAKTIRGVTGLLSGDALASLFAVGSGAETLMDSGAFRLPR